MNTLPKPPRRHHLPPTGLYFGAELLVAMLVGGAIGLLLWQAVCGFFALLTLAADYLLSL